MCIFKTLKIFFLYYKMEDNECVDECVSVKNSGFNLNNIMDILPYSYSFYSRFIFSCFTILWIIIVMNFNLYDSKHSWILLIPFLVFFVGFINSECFLDKYLCNEIYNTTFMSVCVVISISFLSFANKDSDPRYTKEKINTPIYLSLMSILFLYFHIWLPKEYRFYWKIVRTCFEAFSVTLYMFGLTNFFFRE